jgi:hypothetical protein
MHFKGKIIAAYTKFSDTNSHQMNIKEIAHELNAKAIGFEIGKLQALRKEIKALKKRAGNTIFSENTIFGDYAFHYGGRSEIQYNIGIENEGLRYGLAFSLETSQSLPNPSDLYPKILKLNCLIRERPEFFKSFRMWYYKGKERSDIYEVVEIGTELLSTNIFIFFGDISEEDKISIDGILETFDKLLWVYKTVETDNYESIKSENKKLTNEFFFSNKQRKLAKKTIYTSQEREIDIDIRHTYLQEILQSELEEKYGKENVSIENPFNDNKIDIVVKDNDSFHFYEVKTASSSKACVRQALGQLLEYAYGNGRKNASKIFIAGEFPIDKETNKYLSFLRDEFNIPIGYKLIKIK